MAIERFTAGARMLLVASGREAEISGDADVRTTHLLLAVLRRSDPRSSEVELTAQLVEARGVSEDHVLHAMSVSHEHPEPRDIRLPPTYAIWKGRTYDLPARTYRGRFTREGDEGSVGLHRRTTPACWLWAGAKRKAQAKGTRGPSVFDRCMESSGGWRSETRMPPGRCRHMRWMSSAGVSLVLMFVAAPADGRVLVSPSGVRGPALAINDLGATAVAWERSARGTFAVEARVGQGTLGLGRTQRLSSKGSTPAVAVGADGTAAVQWLEYGPRGQRRVRVAVARDGRPFGVPQTIETRRANVGVVGVAVQPSGRVVAVFWRSGASLAFAVAPRGRGFGAAQQLTATGSLGGASLSVDPRDGAVVVAYGTPLRKPAGDADRAFNVQAAVRTLGPADATFSAPVIVSGQDPAAEAPSAEAYPRAVAGPGGAGVVFEVAGQAPRRVRVALRAADGSWGPARTAGSTAGEGQFPASATAALPRGGAAVAAWLDQRYVVDRLVSSVPNATSARGGDAFAEPTAFDGPRPGGRAIAAAAAGSRSFVAWVAGRSLRLTSLDEGSAFRRVRTMSTSADGDVLLAGAGERAVAAWQERDRLALTTIKR